ncbi:hypothetical protein D3C80_1647240 [compost metagenome]
MSVIFPFKLISNPSTLLLPALAVVVGSIWIRVFCFSVRKIAAVKFARLLNRSHFVPSSKVRASSGFRSFALALALPESLIESEPVSPSASTPTGFADVA